MLFEVKLFNKYEYTSETRHLLARKIISSWEHETLVEYALEKLLQEYESEEAFQEDADHYVEELELNIPEKAPKMTPQMDLSNVDPEVVKRAQARADVEATQLAEEQRSDND